ncbi:MAG: hypothetical protein ACYSTZ_00040 [Planctomycetota bacterium]|jgi:hypothetical protein
MKKVAIVLLTVSIALSGCMGHSANPVQITQPGDTDKDCNQLRSEVGITQQQASRLKSKCDAKLPWNVAMGVAGCFVIVPWFFMDLKCGECGEYDAMQARADYLENLSYEKCK